MSSHNRERGVALLLAIFAIMIITAIGIGLMFMTDTETTINGSYRDEQMTSYAAKAGLEEVRDRMRANAGVSISGNLPSALPGAANGVVYLLNPANSETVAPWTVGSTYFDDEICKEVNCSGGQVPPTAGWYATPTLTANSAYAATPVMPYKWIRLTLKTNQSAWGTASTMYVNGSSSSTTANYYVCWNGTNEVVSSTACTSANRPVYLVTALAVTPSGTRRMVQYELTRDSLNINFPSALVLDGTNDLMGGPNSNPYHMDGADHAGCGGAASQPAIPAIGVPDNADIGNVVNGISGSSSGIPSNRQDHYTGSGAAPDVENVSASMPSDLKSVSALQSLLTTIKNNVTQPVIQGPASSLASPGTSSVPQIIYVNGDLSLNGNLTGYGILVVTGTFSPGGNVGWNGIVLVVGKGDIEGNGGGNNSYNGAVVVAKILDSSGNPLSSLGAATFNWGGGGGNGIYYSSGCVKNASGFQDYRILAYRELMR